MIAGEVVDPRGRSLTVKTSSERVRRKREREKAGKFDELDRDEQMRLARELTHMDWFLEKHNMGEAAPVVRFLLDNGEPGEVSDLLRRLSVIRRWTRRDDDVGELVRASKEGS